MSSPASEEATEKSLPAETIDAEQIQSSIVRLTSNSTGGLEKLMAELGRLQEFLKSETERVQREIEAVMNGTGIIIEALGAFGLANAHDTPTNGRGKLERWPRATVPQTKAAVTGEQALAEKRAAEEGRSITDDPERLITADAEKKITPTRYRKSYQRPSY
jgi:hypothetical protein